MPARLDRATRALLARFQRQRPVRAGSLIVTIFGDTIAPRGAAVTLGSLIQLATPFGINERLVRTSVARLAQEDWLVARRDGRRSEYRLSASGRERFAEATRRIYGEGPGPWTGHWTLLMLPSAAGLPSGARQRRARLREELAWLGFGEPSPGLLAHPTLAPADAQAQLRRLDGAGNGVLVFEAGSCEPDADRALARAGWDLEELAIRYRRFIAAFTPVHEALGAHAVAPEKAFLIRTLLVHEYRRIHLRDPLLPVNLLPDAWIGTAAYELCRALYGQVLGTAERHVTASAETLAGPLPKPSDELFQRFTRRCFCRPA